MSDADESDSESSSADSASSVDPLSPSDDPSPEMLIAIGMEPDSGPAAWKKLLRPVSTASNSSPSISPLPLGVVRISGVCVSVASDFGRTAPATIARTSFMPLVMGLSADIAVPRWTPGASSSTKIHSGFALS